MNSLFSYATLFIGDISKWDVSRVHDMSEMFLYATKFDGDISKWDVAKVTTMTHMFNSATSFNGDISKWDVSKVVDMHYMFWQATSFHQQLCQDAWVNSKASKIEMFTGSSGSILRRVCTATFASKVKAKRAVGSGGACANAHPQYRSNPTLPHMI